MSGRESDTEDWTLVNKYGEISSSQSSDSSLEVVNFDSEVVTFSHRKSSERSVSPSDTSSRPTPGHSGLEDEDKKSDLTVQTTAMEPVDNSSSSHHPEQITTGEDIRDSKSKPSEQTPNDSDKSIEGFEGSDCVREAGQGSLEANKDDGLEAKLSVKATELRSEPTLCKSETSPVSTRSSSDEKLDDLQTDGSTSFTNDEQESMTSSRSSFTALKPESDEEINQELFPLDGSSVNVGMAEKPLTTPEDNSSDADILESRSDADSADSDFIRLEACDSMEVDNTEMTSSSVSSRFSFIGRESSSPVLRSRSSSSSCDALAHPQEQLVGDNGVLHPNQQIDDQPSDLHGNQPVDGDDQHVNNIPQDIIQGDGNHDDNNQRLDIDNQHHDDFHGNVHIGDFHGNDHLDGEEQVVDEFEEEREGNTESDIDDDQDARIESDQSDAGSTPPLDDDMSFVNDIGEIPLVAGDVARQYVHRPNCHLNLTLDVIAVLMITVVVGLGIGHGIATLDEIEEYESVHESMRKTILSCEGKRLEDRQIIKDLQQEYNLLQEKFKDSEKSVEKLRQQNQALFQKIGSSENVEAFRINLKNQINQLEIENEELKRSIGQLKYKPHPSNADSYFNDLPNGQTKSCDRSVTDNQADQQRKLSHYSLDDLEILHDQTSLDNSRLKQEVGRLRYTKHPGNYQASAPEDQKPEVTVESRPKIPDYKTDSRVPERQVDKSSQTMVPDDQMVQKHRVDDHNEETILISDQPSDSSSQSQKLESKTQQHSSILDQARQQFNGKIRQTTSISAKERQVVNDVRLKPGPWKKISELQDEIQAKNAQLLVWQKKYEDVLSRGLVINSTTCLHYLLYNISLTDWMTKIDSHMLNKFVNSYSNVASDAQRSLSDITVNILSQVSHTSSSIWKTITDQEKEGENVETVVQDSNKVAGKREKMEERGSSSDEGMHHKQTSKPNQDEGTKSEKKNTSGTENTTQDETKKTPNEKWSENLKDILNKTRSKMSNVNQQIQDTWLQVKNLSIEFWTKHEPAISRTLDTVSKKVSAIGERLHSKITKRVKNWLRRNKKQKSKHQRHSKQTENKINKPEDKQSDHVNTKTHPRKSENSNKSPIKKFTLGKEHDIVPPKIQNIVKFIQKMNEQLIRNEKQRKKKFEKKSGKKLKKQMKRREEKELKQVIKQFKKLNEKLRHLNEDIVETMSWTYKKLVRDCLGNIHEKFGNGFQGLLRKVLMCRVLFWDFITGKRTKDFVMGRFSSDGICRGFEFDYEADMLFDIGGDKQKQRKAKTVIFQTMEGQGKHTYFEDEEEVDDDDDNDKENERWVNEDKENDDGNLPRDQLKDGDADQHGNMKEHKPDWVFKRATHRQDIRQQESQPDWMFDRARERENVREKQAETDWMFDRASYRDDVRHSQQELWDRESFRDGVRHSQQELWDRESFRDGVRHSQQELWDRESFRDGSQHSQQELWDIDSRQRHPANMWSNRRWNDYDDERDAYCNE